jgi:TPR repeat protein
MTHPGCDPELLYAYLEPSRGGDAGVLRTEDLCWVDLQRVGDEMVSLGDERLDAGDGPGAVAMWLAAVHGTQSAAAMFRIGDVAKAEGDEDTCHQWWLRSARLGYARGMTALGAQFGHWGDDEQARLWFERAAGKGDTVSMCNLAGMEYEKRNLVGARYWLSKAAAAGDVEAAMTLQRLPRA